MTNAVEQWRAQFRGDVPVKDDTRVTAEDIASHHLILWGDPESNLILKRIARDLPIRWAPDQIRIGARSFPSRDHVPVLIHPNPLNPSRYVVLNSGFIFGAMAGQSNALQTPQLPDYAVFNVAGPDTPSPVAAAGFFNESFEPN